MVHGQGRRLIRPVVLPTLAVGAPAKKPAYPHCEPPSNGNTDHCYFQHISFPFSSAGEKNKLAPRCCLLPSDWIATGHNTTDPSWTLELMGELGHKHWDCYIFTNCVFQRLCHNIVARPRGMWGCFSSNFLDQMRVSAFMYSIKALVQISWSRFF